MSQAQTLKVAFIYLKKCAEQVHADLHHHSAVDWMGEEGRQVVTGDIVFQDPDIVFQDPDSPGAFLFSVCPRPHTKH